MPIELVTMSSSSCSVTTPSRTRWMASRKSAACRRLATKPGTSFRTTCGRLAPSAVDADGAFGDSGICPCTGDDFDERDEVRRIERMADDEALRLAHRSAMALGGRRSRSRKARCSTAAHTCCLSSIRSGAFSCTTSASAPLRPSRARTSGARCPRRGERRPCPTRRSSERSPAERRGRRTRYQAAGR